MTNSELRKAVMELSENRSIISLQIFACSKILNRDLRPKGSWKFATAAIKNRRGEKLYVQVAYLLAADETITREFEAYGNIRDNFPKYVVSLDEFDMSRNGIKHRNIRDFLLMKEWN